MKPVSEAEYRFWLAQLATQYGVDSLQIYYALCLCTAHVRAHPVLGILVREIIDSYFATQIADSDIRQALVTASKC